MPENQLGRLIADEVAAAESDNKGFRERGVTVIATAGALVAGLTGLLALAAGDRKQILPDDGTRWLGYSLALFVLSSLLGLALQAPSKMTAAGPDELTKFVGENWDDEGWDKSIAVLQLTYLKDLRATNKWLARIYICALMVQVLAVLSLAVLASKIFNFLT